MRTSATACHHVVIDSLMMTDVPEDGPGSMTAQKEAIRSLCDFAKRTGVHVHLVAHPRKGKDESAGPGKMDVAGSGKITDGADNVFTVWRAQKDEARDAPDAKELKKPDATSYRAEQSSATATTAELQSSGCGSGTDKGARCSSVFASPRKLAAMYRLNHGACAGVVRSVDEAIKLIEDFYASRS
jgi:hypothetical protein